MGTITRFAAAFGFLSSCAQAVDNIVWPDLPSKGFISGRVATIDDAKHGDAAFSLNGQSKGPLTIAIPQYVKWTDEHGVSHPMILIQAEQAPDGSKIVGLRDFQRQETVATLPELTLLGTKKPS